MKTLIRAVCAVAVIAVPITSLAQSDGSMTRAQVQAEIVQLQQAGFNPANANTIDFPNNVQAADASASGQSSGFGPATNGSAQMGQPTNSSGMKPVFFGGS